VLFPCQTAGLAAANLTDEFSLLAVIDDLDWPIAPTILLVPFFGGLH
jgi:hypothetical protein